MTHPVVCGRLVQSYVLPAEVPHFHACPIVRSRISVAVLATFPLRRLAPPITSRPRLQAQCPEPCNPSTLIMKGVMQLRGGSEMPPS
eukprot:1332739-Pyramimonas_sp.AAC.1